MLRTASSLPLRRAFDAGLRPGPFTDRAASLLPGLLAATRTGLSPASGDELTDTKIHHGARSWCHLPSCWAHWKAALRVAGASRAVGTQARGRERPRSFGPKIMAGYGTACQTRIHE